MLKVSNTGVLVSMILRLLTTNVEKSIKSFSWNIYEGVRAKPSWKSILRNEKDVRSINTRRMTTEKNDTEHFFLNTFLQTL